MDIPASCNSWRAQMQAGNEESHIVGNVERDTCMPPDVVGEFFTRLAAKSPFSTPAAAAIAARKVVEDDPGRFYCTGREIGVARFAELLRYVTVEKWVYLRPDREEEIRRRYALSGSNWPEAMTDNQRRLLCEELRGDCHVGKPTMIVWVADAGAVPTPPPTLRQVLRCLGLPHFEGEQWTLELRYRRASLGTPLHVPRALDGIGWWPFQVQEDCLADAGQTRPTNQAGPAAVGYPEAVHRGVVVTIDHIDLRSIEDVT